ncbi:hypothetical protein [Nannocystis punicea]|uniref:Uncharacterized protein n=1 Tax=Nannocystis punicea TaxID=2995304 RepID=A0ABY7HCT6_9BACT|nr:hypothetical protein [Nannocystis poenicansa]WAS97079.1 hypothetical protein O0S08_13105 [Nannocystis poenicansa]
MSGATTGRRRFPGSAAGLVLALSLACVRGGGLEVPRAPPAVAVPLDGAPCGDEIAVRPLDVDVTWRSKSLRDRPTFVWTAEGAMLVLSDDSGAWVRIELDAPSAVIRRGTPPLPVHYGLDLAPGERWIYATTVANDSDDDIALGDLHAPGLLARVDPHPLHDKEPVLVARPEGGWAVAWIRAGVHGAMELRFALVKSDGAVDRVDVVDSAPLIRGVRLERMPDGYALVYVHAAAPASARQVVLRLLDRNGASGPLRTLADGEVDEPRVARGSDGLGVVFVRGAAQLMFVAVGFDGAPRSEARQALGERGPLPRARPTALLHHRGRFWLGAEVSHCARHRCVAPAQALVIPLAADGRPGRAVEVARSYDFAEELVLGRSHAGVYAAWAEGRARRRLRVAELRCVQ